MSEMGCWRKMIECVWRGVMGRNTQQQINYSTIDNRVGERMGEQPCQENIKYQSEQHAEVFVQPNTELDLSLADFSIQINGCNESRFFLLRHSASVCIDGCRKCQVVLGPSHGSVFLRNSKDIQIMCISQQLRIQNCENLFIEGITASGPVLQYSKNVSFSPLTCQLYEGLLLQLDKANLNIFTNKIFEVYDFTPKKSSNYTAAKEKIPIMKQLHALWESSLQNNQLECRPRIWFPYFEMTKLSMMKKHLSQKIESSRTMLLCCKMSVKTVLELLSQNFYAILFYVNPELSLKKLKINFKAQILKIDRQEGTWFFLLVSIDQEKSMRDNEYNIFIVEDQNVILQLVSEG